MHTSRNIIATKLHTRVVADWCPWHNIVTLWHTFEVPVLLGCTQPIQMVSTLGFQRYSRSELM